MSQTNSRLIAVPNRLIPIVGELGLLDDESLEQIKGWIQVEQAATSERYRAKKNE